MSDMTARMITLWYEHQKKKPAAPDDYLVNVEHLRAQMDAWQREDDSWRLLIGNRLATDALEQKTKGDHP